MKKTNLLSTILGGVIIAASTFGMSKGLISYETGTAMISTGLVLIGAKSFNSLRKKKS